MLIRSLAFILIVVSSFVIVTGQSPDAQKTNPDKTAKTSGAPVTQKTRDLAFPQGVDLQFLIKELARDLDLNVLFDPETFRSPGQKVRIDIKNVTAAEAIDYIFLQESLFFEEAGPKTILVASRFKGRWIPQIGVGLTVMTEQLAQYFGANGGMLISTVRNNSPGSKAGLKAGDVIVEIDGVPITRAPGIVPIDSKKENDVILTIVRDRKRETVSVTPEKGIGSVLQKPV